MPQPGNAAADNAAGIAEQVQAVRARIGLACAAAGRTEASVKLLAVSKTFASEAVQAAHAGGQRAFGENYVQEGVKKIVALAAIDAPERHLEWHFIGPLQSNKTREVAEHFDWVHTIDRLKIAERLSAQRPAHLPPLQICIQVNVSGEASKSGVIPSAAEALARAVAALPRLQLRGLMSIPEPVDATRLDAAAVLAAQRAPHRALRFLFIRLNASGLALDTLSMGMSADLEAAVLEGATLVRVGSAIFGARPNPGHPET